MTYFRNIIQVVVIILLVVSFLTGNSRVVNAAHNEQKQTKIISKWQMLWVNPGESFSIGSISNITLEQRWITIDSEKEYPTTPAGIETAWIKFQLPNSEFKRPAMILNKLYAKKINIYIDEESIYHLDRNYSFNLIEVIIPFEKSEESSTVYLEISNNTGKMGIYEDITIGEFDLLQKKFMKSDLLDLVLGASLILLSFFMISSVLFIHRKFQPGWYSLFLVMLSVGIMILTYSSFLDKYFPEYGILFNISFDVASSVFMPAFFYFFEKVFGKGPFGLISKYKVVQTWFALLYTLALFISFFSDYVYNVYYTHGYIVFGLSIIIGNMLLIVSLIYECKNKNKEAIILAIGISVFASVGLIEVFWYMYLDNMYIVQFWKVGILFFLASLLIILVRRVMSDYYKALEYSRHIEIFNEELQRSEKIELISNLAASIAHEVRNPLQVTRGFLQLLGGRLGSVNEKQYVTLAINELDRASEIITDFLTFAKPDLGNNVRLNAYEELNQIVAILAPLAILKGGIIKYHSGKEVYILGSSSKFKQAMINIIKNSIEACGEGGEISIKVFKIEDRVNITIKDNGEGIEEEDIKRLGEPYYTKKTKGTGLGLMVTFRIIEAMNGQIKFESQRGVGTEVSIILPAS